MNDPISITGLILFAVLMPAGLLLAVGATGSTAHSHRLGRASAGAFLVLAAWFLVAIFIRAGRGELGPVFWIEILLLVGTLLEGWWVWRTLGSGPSDREG